MCGYRSIGKINGVDHKQQQGIQMAAVAKDHQLRKRDHQNKIQQGAQPEAIPLFQRQPVGQLGTTDACGADGQTQDGIHLQRTPDIRRHGG